MAENSGISWTDNTFNPWMGCTKVSPACAHCYAERDFDHRYGKVKWGPSGTRVLTSDENWKKPLRWNRDAAKDSSNRPRVFCASLADIFEEWNGAILDHNGKRLWINHDNGEVAFLGGFKRLVEETAILRYLTMDDVRNKLFALIDATPNLDWLLLTKRPENIRRMWNPWCTLSTEIPVRRNVWLGTSVENSDYLHRIDSLKACGGLADVLFLSMEPLLGPTPTIGEHLGGIDWVIAGGESGPNSRPSNPDWFRSVRDQCDAHGVPFHFKQWGEYGVDGVRIGTKAAGRVLDGETHDAFPTVANRF